MASRAAAAATTMARGRRRSSARAIERCHGERCCGPSHGEGLRRSTARARMGHAHWCSTCSDDLRACERARDLQTGRGGCGPAHDLRTDSSGCKPRLPATRLSAGELGQRQTQEAQGVATGELRALNSRPWQGHRGRRKRQGQECLLNRLQPVCGVLWPNFSEPECLLAKCSKVSVRQQRTITLDVCQTIVPYYYDSDNFLNYHACPLPYYHFSYLMCAPITVVTHGTLCSSLSFFVTYVILWEEPPPRCR